LHHFFEAQMPRNPTAHPKHLPFKKTSTFFSSEKLLPQMPLGVKWLPGVAASRQSSEGKRVAVLF
jgi:hypothetical protein